MTGHIQVGGASPRVQYAANGTQAAFTFPFPIFSASDLEVWVGHSLQSNITYALSGVGISAGGTVLFTAPPPAGSTVTLRRRLVIARVTDYQEDGIIRAKLLNDELDVQTASIQQVAEDASRAVMRSFLSSNSADLTLPEPEAGKALGWNADGTGLTNDPAAFVVTTATVSALAAQTAADRAVAQTMAAAAQTARAACDADVAITGDDRTAIAADRAAVAADRAAVAADRASVAADKVLVAADAAATHTDRLAADADAAAAALDRSVVAADAAAVAADRAAAAASASAAHASELAAAASAASASAAASGGAVKVSATDTTSDYLASTLSAGANISLSIQNVGAHETLRIAVTGLASVATSGAYDDLSGRPSLGTAAALAATTSTTLSGNSDAHLPTEKAVKTYVDTVVAANSGIDPYPDIGQLYLSLARLDTPTSPNAGGTQVADEFDDATGISSLGSATVVSGYLANPGSSGSDLVPTMTGNTTPSGIASGSNTQANGDYWNCFDNVDGGISYLVLSGTTGHVAYEFASATVVNKYTVAMNGANTDRDAKSWTFDGWNGSSWVTLDTQSNQSFSGYTKKAYTFSNATAYTKYRLNCTANNGNGSYWQVGEIEMMQLASPANITTVSNAYTAAAAPSAVSLVVEYQDVAGSSVVGTDITFEVSRDGGITWTTVAMVDFGPSIVSGARVLKGTASVAGQPGGTSVKWRIKTFNAKEQRVHGLWMQWK